MTTPHTPAARPPADRAEGWVGGLTLVALVVAVWAYLPTLAEMAERWRVDTQYSHGYLVPAFSAYLLWMRRGRLANPDRRGRWLGVGLVALGLAVRVAGSVAFVGWLDGVSLPVCLLGLAGAWRGRAGLRWAAPAAGFLVFMVPLPWAVQTAMSGRLQGVATAASTYLLVSAGTPAVSEGNVILLANGTRIGVVEACSGLGMLMAFVALSAAIALVLTSEPAWARVIVVLSSVPVAVLANVLRITVTGLLYQQSQDEWARWVFHDVAGWLMMPAAAGMFFALLWVVRRTAVPVTTET